MASDGDYNPQFQSEIGLNKLDVLHSIALSSINSEDSAFHISTQSQNHKLVAAIQQMGLLHPPILKQRDSGYGIVCGFRRIEACRQIGWSEVPAFILDPDTPDSACALYAIADNSFQRPLNLIEISRSLYLLSSHFKDESVQLKYASLLGLSTHRTHMKKIEKICHLPKPIQDSILADTLSLAVALDLSELDSKTAVALVRLFDQLNIGLNKQRQLILLFKEIAQRENTTVYNLMNEKEVRQILNNTELDRVQISQQIKSYLKKRRYPTITQFRKDFEKQVKALKLGNSVSLIPPKDFEGTTYTLTLRYDSHAELKDLKSKLDRVVQSAGLKRILEGKLE